MNKFKKGLSLIAAIAFLITALIPVAGLAADAPQAPVTLTDAATAAAGLQLRPAQGVTSWSELSPSKLTSDVTFYVPKGTPVAFQFASDAIGTLISTPDVKTTVANGNPSLSSGAPTGSPSTSVWNSDKTTAVTVNEAGYSWWEVEKSGTTYYYGAHLVPVTFTAVFASPNPLSIPYGTPISAIVELQSSIPLTSASMPVVALTANSSVLKQDDTTVADNTTTPATSESGNVVAVAAGTAPGTYTLETTVTTPAGLTNTDNKVSMPVTITDMTGFQGSMTDQDATSATLWTVGPAASPVENAPENKFAGAADTVTLTPGIPDAAGVMAAPTGVSYLFSVENDDNSLGLVLTGDVGGTDNSKTFDTPGQLPLTVYSTKDYPTATLTLSSLAPTAVRTIQVICQPIQEGTETATNPVSVGDPIVFNVTFANQLTAPWTNFRVDSDTAAQQTMVGTAFPKPFTAVMTPESAANASGVSFQWYESATQTQVANWSSIQAAGLKPIPGATGLTYNPTPASAGTTYYACVATYTVTDNGISRSTMPVAATGGPFVGTVLGTIAARNNQNSFRVVAAGENTEAPGNPGTLAVVPTQTDGSNSWEFSSVSPAPTFRWQKKDADGNWTNLTASGSTYTLQTADFPPYIDDTTEIRCQMIYNGNVIQTVPFTLTAVSEDAQDIGAPDSNGVFSTTVYRPNVPVSSTATASLPVNMQWGLVNGPFGTVLNPPAANVTYTLKLVHAPEVNATLTLAGNVTKKLNDTWTADTLAPVLSAARVSNVGQYEIEVTAAWTSDGGDPTARAAAGQQCQAVGKIIINPAGKVAVVTSPSSMLHAIQPANGQFPTELDGASKPAQSINWDPAKNCGVITVKANSRVQLYLPMSMITVGGQPATWMTGAATDVEFEWKYKTSAYTQDDGNALTLTQDKGFFGVNSNLLTVGPITPEMDGQVFAVNVRSALDENDYQTSMWVELDVDGVETNVVPQVTLDTYPEMVGNTVTQTENGIVTLTANAQVTIPESMLKYQWQQQAPATAAQPNPAWQTIDGATSKTYELDDLDAALNGYKYQCVVTNTAFSTGVNGTSPVVTLRVTNQAGAVIITSPVKAVLRNLFEGRTATMDVAAKTDNGDDVTYQWYCKGTPGPIPNDPAVTTIDQAKAYVAASPAKAVEGATGTTLTTGALEQGIYEYSCRVQNTSNAAQTAVSAPVYIVVTQKSRIPDVSPARGTFTNVGVMNGDALTLTADAYVASGEPLTYTWYTRRGGTNASWSVIPNATEATLTIPNITTQYTGYEYNCIVTNPAAAKSTNSGIWYVNVWNNANIPTVTSFTVTPQSPIAVGSLLPSGSTAGQTIKLTSTATLPQGADHANMLAAWYWGSGNTLVPVSGSVFKQSPAEFTYISPTTSASGVKTYTSELTIDLNGLSTEAATAAAREITANSPITCRWFNPQNGSQQDLVVSGETLAAQAGQLAAPQTAGSSLPVEIIVPGDPRITVQPAEKVSAAVGQTASFTVGSVLNPVATSPQPSTVYVWQMSTDGGVTWNNCTAEDGTGQFTSTFTTIPLTQEMYDNATASNVTGNPNAKTVYQYRVIVANYSTGIKKTSNVSYLTITPGTEQPTTAVLKPAEGANVTITSDEALGKVLCGDGLTVTKDGNPASAVQTLVVADPENENYKIQIVSGSGDDQKVLTDTDIVATGDMIQLVNTADNDAVLDSATIVVRGDVMENGQMSLTQLVWLAEAFKGERELTGAALLAGDLDANGSVNLTDLVREATIYKVECMGSTEPPATPSEESAA